MSNYNRNKQNKQVLPVMIHDDILSKIFKYYLNKKRNHTALAHGLYSFLYHTARRQNNIRVYATDKFIMKGTGIGETTLTKLKKDLVELELIEVIQDRANSGSFGKRYIEVKFVWKPETMDKLFYQESTKTTEYKIAQSLLKNSFNPFDDMESSDTFEFDVIVNGNDTLVFAESFYFDDYGLLVANGYLHPEMDEDSRFNYTVTTDRVHDVLISIASNYKFSFDAILSTLSKEPP